MVLVGSGGTSKFLMLHRSSQSGIRFNQGKMSFGRIRKLNARYCCGHKWSAQPLQGPSALTDLDEMRRLGLHSIQSLCRVTTCMTQPHSQNLSDWAGITGISSQVASAVLVIWKLLGCLSSGEAKSGLTCPIPRLLSSPGLLDVEIVCKALSLLWTMDMF